MAKPEKIMKRCQTCKGTGKMTGDVLNSTGKTSVVCPWCKGKGFVFKAPKK